MENRAKWKMLASEFFVVFLSVVLAFFFEDFRESQNERNQYKETFILYSSELDGMVQSMRSKLDSVKVDNLRWSGEYYQELQEYLWLDSLLDQRKATMNHFRYFYKQGYLDGLFIPSYGQSPLSDEIRKRHGEYASNSITRRMLPRYNEGMHVIDGLNGEFTKTYSDLNEILLHTDPLGEYGDSDSLIFYSNEFRGIFKNLTVALENRNLYLNYLTNDRWIVVFDELRKEAERLGISVDEDALCYRMTDYVERFTCWEGEVPKNPILIDDYLQEKRARFFNPSNAVK